jgi:NTE family protein
MPAIARDDMILVDGGIVDFVPTGPLKNFGADVVIGVDVGSCLGVSCAIEDGIDAMHRSMEVMSFFLNRHGKENVNIMIEPAVSDIPWTDFLRYKELIHIGEVTAESKLEEITKLVSPKFRERILQWPRKIFKQQQKGEIIKLERVATST